MMTMGDYGAKAPKHVAKTVKITKAVEPSGGSGPIVVFQEKSAASKAIDFVKEKKLFFIIGGSLVASYLIWKSSRP